MRRADRNGSLQIEEGASGLRPQAEGDAKLEVSVIFTTYQGARAGLRAAANLACNLDARIRFLVPQVVPFAFPLHQPPVSVAFTERRSCAMALACAEVSEVQVEIYLCRDNRAALLRALRAQSIVVVGGRKRWWPSSEQKLAKILRLRGHRVIFVNQSGVFGSRTEAEKSL